MVDNDDRIMEAELQTFQQNHRQPQPDDLNGVGESSSDTESEGSYYLNQLHSNPFFLLSMVDNNDQIDTEPEGSSESSTPSYQQPNNTDESSSDTDSEGSSESSSESNLSESSSYEYGGYRDYWPCDGLCCLKNRKKDLPLFDGTLAYYDFHLWIYDVELYFEFYEIPEDRKVEFVASRLREGALTWWKQYQNPKQQPIQEWKLMKAMLIAQFLKVDYDRVFFDIPILKKNTNPDEFREWVRDVEKAFKVHKIYDSRQLELVVCRLEEGVFSWWQQIQNLSCRIHNKPVEKWEHMKNILMARFASVEYERVDDLPRFRTNFSFDEFSVWVGGVERFFELNEIQKDLQVGLVASRFEEGTALEWWRQMQYLSMRVDKLPIQDWAVMKTMLMTRFLSPNDSCLVNNEEQWIVSCGFIKSKKLFSYTEQ